jgi:hypothetical protein
MVVENVYTFVVAGLARNQKYINNMCPRVVLIDQSGAYNLHTSQF